MGRLHILFVEDQALDAELCEHELRRSGLSFTSTRVCSRAAYIEALETTAPAVILSDFSMPTDLDGFGALAIAREKAGGVPFIFVSGTIGEERAVAAMKAGATDYVLKDNLERLGPVVRRALAEARDRSAMLHAQDALRASEATFRSFMQHLPGHASIRDLHGRYTYVNDLWQEANGLDARDVIGRPYDPMLDASLAREVQAMDGQVISHNAPVRRVLKTGAGDAAKWWLAHHFPIPGAGGEAALVGSIAIDVTEQKLQEQKLARLGRIHALLSGTNAAIVRHSDGRKLMAEACRIAVEHGRFAGAWVGLYDGTRGKVKPVASAGLGSGGGSPGTLAQDGPPEPGSMIARMIERGEPVVCDPRDQRCTLPAHRREDALNRGIRSVVVLPLRAGAAVIGAFTLLATEADAFADDELELLMQLTHDVSFALAYIDKEEKLAYLAWHDPVTGLGNRALLHERLDAALAAARDESHRIAVLVWDVKRFSTVNDSLGREAGDALLRSLARRLGRLWPELSDMARLSADKFAGLVTVGAGAPHIAYLLERSAGAISEPYAIRGDDITVDIAVGIAFYPDHGRDAEAVLANAEAALKQAKAGGERFLFYEPAMNARPGERLSLEGKLRRALDREQFVLHYEPKIDLVTGRVSGLEALIRWNDPEGGLVPPQAFVPVLEETGLILDVGRWAIETAIAHWKTLAARGRASHRVAVNVSALQLRRKDFVDGVAAVLARCEDGAHGLDLEITESLLMQDIESNTRKLEALKEMGVNIAIDDFGTGYSSLSYLARLPADALKIDGEFIRTMPEKPQSMTIVSTIISLAHTLHMLVVAEGVETSEQANLLRDLRCDQAQGYFFSKPEDLSAARSP
jgi:diguanylate cyclase (GGDEF)-like protein/PAS domain S-box-containing protein